MSSDPDDEKFLECALELEAEAVVSGGADLPERGGYMRLLILTPQDLPKQVEEALEE